MRRAATAIAAALAAMAAAGCGVNVAQEGAKAKRVPGGGVQSNPLGNVRVSTRPLPTRPAGLVALDGEPSGGLASALATGFIDANGTHTAFQGSSEQGAFSDLCAGNVDVVETARLPTLAEQRACAARGVSEVGPVQVGSDAIVLATKNEADVGGDCITTTQARDIYRAGSPYDNWGQLGFFDIPMRVTGREDRATLFTFFGNEVLNLADATLADVRSDYIVHNSDLGVREEVTNDARVRAAGAAIVRHHRALFAATLTARRNYVNAAVRAADRRVLGQIAATNARNARLKLNVNGAVLAARNARLDATAKRRAALAANARYDVILARRNAAYDAAVTAAARQAGTIGYFRFSYYALFEEKLRPMEIDFGVPETGDGQPVTLDQLPSGYTPGSPVPAKTRDGHKIYAGPNCVFPSQFTITTGAYPLSRRLFLFTSRQALRRAEVQAFFTSVLAHAQTVASQQNLIPITDSQRLDDYKLLGLPLPADLVAQQQAENNPAATATTPTTTATTGTATGGPASTTGTTTTGTAGTSTTATTTGAGTTSTAGTTPSAAPNAIPGVSSR